MPSGSDNYFIRVRGRVRGPYDLGRLRLLHARGQLSRVHQVSTDGQSWVSAATLTQVFANKTLVVQPKLDSSADALSDEKQWYYQKHDQSHGPISDQELQVMIQGGELSGNDPVCEVGATEWSTVEAISSIADTDEPSGTPPWKMIGLLTLTVVVSLVAVGILAGVYWRNS